MLILKKGSQVKVISGKDKGKTGEILEIDRKLQKVKNVQEEDYEKKKHLGKLTILYRKKYI